jgi:hypothetical protein
MKTKKQRIVTILLSAIVIVGKAFLLNLIVGSSKAEISKAESPNEIKETSPTVSETEQQAQKVQFHNKIAEYDGLTMEVLSITSSGNDAIVEVLWELKDSRDWKINNAVLEIDSQEYSYAGFDLVEGLFHYMDGTACKIDMHNYVEKDDCSAAFLQETPYRVDRLIFANVPGDFLNRSIQLRILGMVAFPSESDYCGVLNIEHIQNTMQAEFPGVELECFQKDGLQDYAIKESSHYAKDEKALAVLSDHAGKALFGNMAGIWKFDLTPD